MALTSTQGPDRTRSTVIAVALLMSSPGIAFASPDIRTHPVPAYVVSSITLPVPAGRAKSVILEALETTHERDDPYYRSHGFKSREGGTETWVALHAEDKPHAVFGKAFFKDPTNAQEIYVHSMGQSVLSAYYYTGSRPLDYAVEFDVSIEPVDASHCRISVHSTHANVYIGKTFNLHAFGFVSKSVPVAASPLEQYRLLAYVSHVLGTEIQPL
jgi:hypothetical protein